MVEIEQHDITLKRQDKDVSVEFLRIIAMIMIVLLHIFNHGNILESLVPFSANYYVAWTIESFSYVAVNIYILISGYFLINSQFRVLKAVNIYIHVWFYTITSLIIMVTLSGDISLSSIIISIFPMFSGFYWFASVYFAIYILSPYINIAIRAMTKRQHGAIIIVFLVFFATFFGSRTLSSGGGNGIVWFVCLYTIGAFMRLYYVPSYKIKRLLFLYIITGLSVPLSKFLLAGFTTKLLGYDYQSSILIRYNSILVLAASVTLFALFLNIRVQSTFISNIILFISPLTFGVYLLHDNRFWNIYLWNNLINVSSLANEPTVVLVLGVIGSALAVFATCAAIDYIRQLLFRRLHLNRMCKVLADKISLIAVQVEGVVNK